MRPTRQLPVSWVATKRKDGGRVVHADELNVKAAIRGHLGNKRYKTTRDAPIAQGKLLEDLSHLANTPAAAEILSGNYRFPPGTDEATISVLKAAAEVYSKNKGIVDLILKHEDFIYWQTAREKTESSRSRMHFGHMMSQAFSKRLTHLKLLQLNMVLKMGTPLKRLLNGLTLMLEKEAGNINTSLLVLGRVIKALRHNQGVKDPKKHQQVPFR